MTIPITPILWTLVIRGFADPLWTTLVTFINQRMTLINCVSTRIWIVHQFGRSNFWCFLCNSSLYMLNLLIFNVFLFGRLLAFQFASADSKRTWFWSWNLPFRPLFLYILLKDCFDNADQGFWITRRAVQSWKWRSPLGPVHILRGLKGQGLSTAQVGIPSCLNQLLYSNYLNAQ